MGIITYLVLLALQGLVIGGLARLALPGPDPMSIPMTMLVGIGGAFIGGLIVYAITGGAAVGGFLVALVVAVGIVYLIRRSRGQGLGSTRRDSRSVRF